jgi:hypothetical protein
MLAAAALPAGAQEKSNLEKPPVEAKLPTEPCCGNKVLWVDYWVPVRTLYARELPPVKEPCATWDVVYETKDETVTEIVIEADLQDKEVTYYTTEEVKTVDPVTGCAKTCVQQVPHTKKVKEAVFKAVPKQFPIKVTTAKLVPVTAEILHKYTIYEWKTDMVKKGCAVSMPGGETANTHECIVAPMPCLPHEGFVAPKDGLKK